MRKINVPKISKDDLKLAFLSATLATIAVLGRAPLDTPAMDREPLPHRIQHHQPAQQ